MERLGQELNRQDLSSGKCDNFLVIVKSLNLDLRYRVVKCYILLYGMEFWILTAYLGHILRNENNELPQLIINGKVEGKKPWEEINLVDEKY